MSENRMNWKDLLTPEYLSAENRKPKQARNPFEEDYSSVISSQSFRALQDKTQVFPLDKGDYVRTRLTHSIAVSTIARQIVARIFGEDGYAKNCKFSDDKNEDSLSLYVERKEFLEGEDPKSKEIKEAYEQIKKDLSDYFKYISDDEAEDNPQPVDKEREYLIHVEQIRAIVACAGLLHDMGNPPFGHYGEEVIRNWFNNLFKDNDNKDYEMLKDLTDEMRADFELFEGNAQIFRLLNKRNGKSSDLQVKMPVINSIIKYPNTSKEIYDEKKAGKKPGKDEDVRKHKNGYYYSEFDAMKEIGEKLGTGSGGNAFVRHSLTYIMEAADDIAYATADLMDAVNKEVFTVDQFIKDFRLNLRKMLNEKEEQYCGKENEFDDPEELKKWFKERIDGLINYYDPDKTKSVFPYSEVVQVSTIANFKERSIILNDSLIEIAEPSRRLFNFERRLIPLRQYLNEAYDAYIKNDCEKKLKAEIDKKKPDRSELEEFSNNFRNQYYNMPPIISFDKFERGLKESRNLNPGNRKETSNVISKEVSKEIRKTSEEEAALYSLDKGAEFIEFEEWLNEQQDYLIDNAARMFLLHYKEIMEGTYKGDLFSSSGKNDDIYKDKEIPYEFFATSEGGMMLELLKKPMPKFVYDSTEIVEIELYAKTVMETLLDNFTRVFLKYDPEPERKEKNHTGSYTIKDSKLGTVEDRFIHLMPENLLWDYVHVLESIEEKVRNNELTKDQAEKEKTYHKLMTVVDFVSGMTDSYASHVYGIITGQK